MSENEKLVQSNFIRDIIDEHNRNGHFENRVHTRFPPEPNGYLHIGHAKSICLNYGIARDYKGKFNLRFDDTNPVKEEVEYVESIIEDVKWLGADFEDRILFASDYFDQMYEYAVQLVEKGVAYVDGQTPEQIREQRGTPNEPGKNSPHRERSIEENLDLFTRMKNGEFKDGEYVLRAKIDMSSPNINLRDPIMYRILHADHHRTGDKWCIYPMYDWAHGLEDSIEGITHSICTLEFENHRPLYDWYLDQLGVYHPQQIEFARFNLTYTVMSKRKLLSLVSDGHVNGWNDPRMPTISAFRRRGYTPESLWAFTDKIGVAKRENTTDVALLEYSIREDLNKKANRVMAVLNPVKLVLTNYPEGQEEEFEAVNNPEDENAGKRKIKFTRELYIEQDDFQEVPHKKFFRLQPGGEVRLRYACIIKCEEVIKDEAGNIIELRCTFDPETKSGSGIPQRKVKGTIHWVSAKYAIDSEVRLYDRLFNDENPDGKKDGTNYLDYLNPNSLEVITNAKLEPSLASAAVGEKFQFERLGYFCVDQDSEKGRLVFNRTVTLRDSWSKIQK
ncbi:MAG: glutamine--tRNA ligase/YqeY domain fusion protein [Bacteroidetes bacterium]|nr:glutamine--tRNA ligase/YqeY domain fusion protein [Bacteroidota bacterium]